MALVADELRVECREQFDVGKCSVAIDNVHDAVPVAYVGQVFNLSKNRLFSSIRGSFLGGAVASATSLLS